jgi:competence protein ComEC
MPRVHFVNVHPGDCTIIQHASGNVSMIDICDGNAETVNKVQFHEAAVIKGAGGNFGMCKCNTNPIDYCHQNGISKIFRFVLSHPDMDHMDGFNRLIDELGIVNFWDSGARREKPNFRGGPFFEEDWDRYVRVRDGKEPGVTVVRPLDGARFKFANQKEDGSSGGDGLHILAPNKALLDDCNLGDDINEGSYVVLYRSMGGKVLLCGDAHDAAFDHIEQHHAADVKNVAVLLAPHHGRASDRSYAFLDLIRPKLTIIGCAPSEYIDYAQWSRRDLPILTSNQAGNIVLEIENGFIDVYVQNRSFAISVLGGEDQLVTNDRGYYRLWRIIESSAKAPA